MDREPRGSSGVALAGILIVAFSLRLGIVGVGPVLSDIRDDTHMSNTVAGVLTTIPFVCIGVFALLGGRVMTALGRQSGVAAGLVLMSGGTLLRAAAPSPVLLIVATVPIGVGIALVNIALAGVVKDRFPSRPGAMTGAYIASLSIGSAAMTAGIVPLADALGGWREAFAVTALPTMLGLAFWAVAGTGRVRAGAPVTEAPPRHDRQVREAILLGLTFGFQSICYSAIVAWGPEVYIEHGWSQSRAGALTAIFPLVAIVTGVLASRTDGHDRRRIVVGGAVLQTIGMLGIALVPTAAAFAWITIFAFGNSIIFALSLTLALDVGRDPHEAAWLTSWTLGLGFLMSAVSPIVIGALHDLTGGFTIAMTSIGLLGMSAAFTSLAVRIPPREQHWST